MNKHKSLSLFVALTSLALLFTVAGFLGFASGVGNSLAYLLRPFTRVAYVSNTNLSNLFASFWAERPGEQELKDQLITHLEQKLVAFESIKRENELLRGQLKIDESEDREYSLARIIGENPDDFSKTLFIDRGSRDGLDLGMPVVSEGALIGRLVEVYEHTSELQLITDPESVLQVYLLESGAKGLLKGSLGLNNLLLTQVSKDFEIKEGEHVLSLGIDLNGIKDLLIGKVESQETEDKATYQTLKVEPTINLSTLEHVFVIKRQQ